MTVVSSISSSGARGGAEASLAVTVVQQMAAVELRAGLWINSERDSAAADPVRALTAALATEEDGRLARSFPLRQHGLSLMLVLLYRQCSATRR